VRSAGIVLILSGVFVAAAVLHSKRPSSPSSSASGSSGGGSADGLVHQFKVSLPGGGDVTVNASDPQAAIENVQLETGQTGTAVGLIR
jgi:hypothetical protein